MDCSKNYYSEIAKGYDELYYEEQIKKWYSAEPLLNIKPNEKILDVGCGTGIITKQIYNKCKNVWGVDISEGMLSVAKEVRSGPNYLLSDAKNLPFQDKTFDKVVSFTMLQDLPKNEWEVALREIARVCKHKALITILKHGKNIDDLSTLLSKFFTLEKSLEEEKDFIFLCVPK
ncbi:MAG: class I SAM-dependent methyltransferase [Candidatus Nanoarchaeia archaeon]